MKKFILLILITTLSIFANEEYVLDNENSNAYFKSQADILFFVDDEIIGTNQALKGKLQINKEAVNGEILIDSSAFNIQNDKRDEHITEILNFKKFDNIIITILKETVIEDKVNLNAKLFINGVSKKVNIPVRKKYEDHRLTYTGKLIIKYSDYNIQAPTLAGFIKQAKDELEIGARVVFVKSK